MILHPPVLWDSRIVAVEGQQACDPITCLSGASSLTFTIHYATILKAIWIGDGASNINITASKFWRLGGNGVVLSDFARESFIADNEFGFLGESGIVSVGSAVLNNGTAPTYPRKNTIKRNHIHDIGLWGAVFELDRNLCSWSAVCWISGLLVASSPAIHGIQSAVHLGRLLLTFMFTTRLLDVFMFTTRLLVKGNKSLGTLSLCRRRTLFPTM
jgi:hypothetical protein